MLIGGQAVIEGVMMRSPHWTSTAVHLPSGQITSFPSRFDSLLLQRRWLRIPVIRGAIVLYEALVLGVRALFQSANAVLGDDEVMTPQQVTLSVIAGLGLAVGLFFVLPTVAARFLDRYLANVYTLNLAEGGLRVAILIGYIAGIGRLPDIRRVFAYHGAEHKAVNAHEAGVPLDVPHVRAHSRFHPRCGTSFLLIVMLVSIFVFALLGKPETWGDRLLRFAFIPVIGGIAFEFIRLSAKEKFARFLRPAIWPGLTLQKVTTREPSDDMLEVAIAALVACLDYQNARLEIPS